MMLSAYIENPLSLINRALLISTLGHPTYNLRFFDISRDLKKRGFRSDKDELCPRCEAASLSSFAGRQRRALSLLGTKTSFVTPDHGKYQRTQFDLETHPHPSLKTLQDCVEHVQKELQDSHVRVMS